MLKKFFTFYLLGVLLPLAQAQTLDLSAEGVYRIDLECQANETSQFCSTIKRTWALTLLEDGQSVYVSLLEEASGKGWYLFESTLSKEDPNTFTGTAIQAPGFQNLAGQISLTIDPKQKTITGWLRDPAFKMDLKISGSQKHIPTFDYPVENVTLFSQNLKGTYQGQLPTANGILYLNVSSVESGLIGSWIDEKANSRVDFSRGDITENESVFTLISRNGHPGIYQKWILNYTDNGGTPVLSGSGFSTYFVTPLRLRFSLK